MTEQNQALVTDDYILPDDYQEEDEQDQADQPEESLEVDGKKEYSEEVAQEEVQQPSEEAAQSDAFKWDDLAIKFNKEEKKLSDFTPEEVREYVQKGMNYNKLQEKLAHAEQLNGFEDVSKLWGYEPSEFMDVLRSQYFEQMADRNGSTAEFERRAYEVDAKERAQQALEAQVQEEQRRNADFNLFVQNNPNVDPKSIPPEVFKDAEVMGLQAAYERFENKQLKTQLAQLQQKANNLKSAPVTKTTGNGGDGTQGEDDFLAGLLGG